MNAFISHGPLLSRHRALKSLSRVTCRAPDPSQPLSSPSNVPEWIHHLDLGERQRRQSPELPKVQPEVTERLRNEFPMAKQFFEHMDKQMALDDYDPSDDQVFSWLYKRTRPTLLATSFKSLVACFVAFFAVKLIQFIKLYEPKNVIANAIVSLDTVFTSLFVAIVPAFLLIWAFYKTRLRDADVDGIRRSLIMFSMTALTLPAVWAMTATANTSAGMVCGLFVRFMLMISLWWWSDLRQETSSKTALLGRVYRIWHTLVTLTVMLFGIASRLCHVAIPQIEVRSIFEQRADIIRVFLGNKFPVACSLCNDPGGLFLLGSLVIVGLTSYALYVLIFVTNCGQINRHRRTVSVLTSSMITRGVYQPNVHPEELRGRMSRCTENESFLPSKAMLLRPDKNLQVSDSMFFTTDDMPVFTYLKREEDVKDREGFAEWLKPRSKQFEVSGEVGETERDRRALILWARPLEPEEEKLSIEDFFQTVEDDEYLYDPVSGNWVFSDEKLEQIREAGEKGDDQAEESKLMDPFQLNGKDDEMIEVPAEWKPLINRIMQTGIKEQEGKSEDDDFNGDSKSAYA